MNDRIISWLLTSISGTTEHAIAPWAAWHGRLMVLGWSVLLPAGMLIARFFKVRPRDRPMVLDPKLWWRTHVAMQCTGVGVVTLGIVMALGRAHEVTALAVLHHRVGWSLLAIGWIQIAGGLLRGTKGGPTSPSLRGDHYDMTRRRVAFEMVHKTLGWLAIPLVVVGSGLGLVLADAPRWMPVLLGAWWALLASLFVRLQRSGRCLDTYHVIWGPGVEHPGNRRKPIGWGISRYTQAP